MDVSKSSNATSLRRDMHRRIARREQGMTTLGLLILVVFVGLFAFAALRLTPVYLNYLKVVGVLDGVYKEFDSQNPTRSAIRTSISRRFDVESVSVITARDIEVTPQEFVSTRRRWCAARRDFGPPDRSLIPRRESFGQSKPL
jgi:hypothetical protein